MATRIGFIVLAAGWLVVFLGLVLSPSVDNDVPVKINTDGMRDRGPGECLYFSTAREQLVWLPCGSPVTSGADF